MSNDQKTLAVAAGSLNQSEPLARLLRTIEEGPLLPAFRHNIQELLAIKDDSYNSMQVLARIILRDLSLSTQILKLVNSVYFQTYRRQIYTITNAVMLLGLDRLRNLALGLRLFEQFQQSDHLAALKRMIVSSYFTAFLSQALVEDDRRYPREEVFITGLLVNFGELITAYYSPEDFKRVSQLAAREGLTHAEAAQQIFQVSLTKLGLVTLKMWKFPTGLIERLEYLHRSREVDSGPEGNLCKLIKTAHNLSQSLLIPNLSNQEWRQRTKQVCRNLGLKPERLDDLLTTSLENLLQLTQILQIDIKELHLSVLPSPQEIQTESAGGPQEPESSEPIGQTIAEDSGDLGKLRFFYKVVAEINQALVTRVSISEIIAMIIEGIYRAIRFDRVIFAMLNPARSLISARYGLGHKVEELLSVFEIPFSPKNNIMARSLAEGKEYLVNLNTRPMEQDVMFDKFWQVSQTTSFLVSPIYVDNVPIGVFYVDRSCSQTPITDEDRQGLQIFRDFTVLSLRTSSSTL